MWPRKKLFPWQIDRGSVPLQSPTKMEGLWWGQDAGPMDAIKYELKTHGRPVDPYEVMPWNNMDPSSTASGLRSSFPHTLHGGKSSYLDNLKGASTPTVPFSNTANTGLPGSEKVYPNTPPPGFGSSYTQIPSGVDPGLVSANARVASGASGAGGGKWKKVIEQLGKMTGPEPDWSLSAQNVGVRSPWSPTNVAWSAVGADMFGRKKKKGPY